MPVVRVCGDLYVPDEDYDPEDRTGLTEEAWLRWKARVGLADFRAGRPGVRPRASRGRMTPRPRQVRGQTTLEEHVDD